MTFLRINKIHGVIAVLGDDNFAILEAGTVKKRFGNAMELKTAFEKHCTALGFKAKAVITFDIVEGEFLSLRFYPTRGGYRVGKKPGRNLCKIGYQKVNTAITDPLSTWLGTLKSYRATANHVPFLRVYIAECLAYAAELGLRPGLPLHKWGSLDGTVHEADDYTFAAFKRCYGVGRHEEGLFRARLKAHLRQHGLCSMLEDRVVEILRLKDAEM